MVFFIFFCLTVLLNTENFVCANTVNYKEHYFNKILVELKEEYPVSEMKDLYTVLGLNDITKDTETSFRKCRVFSSLPFENIREQLLNSGTVKRVEPDIQFRLNEIPNDPLFVKQWGMHNIGQTGGKDDADIDAPEAWDVHTGNGEIIVAVIDTGVDYNHVELKNNTWINKGEIPGNGIDDDRNGYIDDVCGWNFVDWNNNPMDDSDPISHGTHVTGIIGATGNNGTGISGVNWKIRIMSLKCFNKYGYAYLSDILPAVQYAVGNGAKVINCSWGSLFPSKGLEEILDYAGKNGVVVVASAGNWGMDLDNPPKFDGISLGNYPAGYNLPNIISVAASNHSDKLAWFSNYGRVSVDLAAPGVDVLSTKAGNDYRYLSGTSMSAPFVTGTAGLTLSQRPELKSDYVIETILSSVDQIPEFKGKVKTGGRLNLANCMISVPRAGVPDYVLKYVYYYMLEQNQ
ncbi:MAG: S8 family peptidase [Elusimicrobiota bacterium]